MIKSIVESASIQLNQGVINMSHEVITLILLVIVIILLITELIPLSVTGLLIPISLVLLNIVPLEDAFLRLIDPIMFIVTAAFILGEVMFKVGIAEKIGTFVYNLNKKYGKGEKSIILIVMLIAAAMSTVLPNLGVAAALIPIVLSVAMYTGVSRTKLLISLAFASSLGGAITLIGSPTNLMARGSLEAAGVGTLGFFDFAYIGLPLTIIGIIYMIFIGRKWIPERYIESREETPDFKNDEFNNHKKSHQIIAVLVFVLFLLGIIFEKQIGISAQLTSLMCILAVIILKVTTEKEAYKSISWETMFFIFGMITLADAIVYTGAGELVANSAVTLLGNETSSVIILGSLFILTAILTQFMSNTASVGMLAPIGISIATGLGIDPRAVVMAIAVGGSVAFMTPIGTPANTMVMIPGKLKFNDWIKVGTPLVIITLVLVVIILPIVWPSM